MTSAGVYFLPESDQRFHAWCAAHPNGYLLNVAKTFRSNYMVLHRAGCRSFPLGAADGAYTEHAYRKVCADSRAALSAWVRLNGRPDGTFSHSGCVCLRDKNGRT